MNIQEIIKGTQAAGFDVYQRDPSAPYFFYSDGDRIGYLQFDRARGFSVSTVHKPAPSIGSGFSRTDETFNSLDLALEAGLVHAPRWASGQDVAAVVKYASITDFLTANEWNTGFRKVEVVV